MFSSVRKDFKTIINKKVEFSGKSMGPPTIKIANRSRCINKFKTLLSSKKLGMIELVNCGDRKAFKVKRAKDGKGGSVYSGLTHTLETCFYDGAYETPAQREKRRTAFGGPPSLLKKRKSPCKVYGKEHGTLVHRQVEEFTNTLVGKLSMEHFEIRNKNPDPCFKKFARLCSLKGWVPVAAELAVFDAELGVATSIDAVVLDSNTAELVLVELKTSYEGTSYSSHQSDAPMKAPLEFLKDCPLNRALLQLFFTSIIVEKNYRVTPDKCVVVRICPKQDILEVYTMPDWTKNRAVKDSVYSAVLLRDKNAKKLCRNLSSQTNFGSVIMQ